VESTEKKKKKSKTLSSAPFCTKGGMIEKLTREDYDKGIFVGIFKQSSRLGGNVCAPPAVANNRDSSTLVPMSPLQRAVFPSSGPQLACYVPFPYVPTYGVVLCTDECVLYLPYGLDEMY
jgi:hypothetical protein